MSSVILFVQFFIAIGAGALMVAVINSLMWPKTRAEVRASQPVRHRQSVAELERDVFRPIEDVIREAERAAMPEADRIEDEHTDYFAQSMHRWAAVYKSDHIAYDRLPPDFPD